MSKSGRYSKHHQKHYEKYEEQSKKRHYNKLAFRKAMQLVNSNPYRAKKLYEEYLQEYPDDYMAQAFYASIIITLKEFEKAEKIIKDIEEKIFVNGHIIDDFKKQHNDEESILFSKIRLMSYQGQYQKLLDFIEENEEYLKRFKLNELKLYCEVKLGINNQKREGQSYLARQIIKYNKEDMSVHASYHTADYNADQEVPKENVFVESFPIYTIFEEIERYIPSDNALCAGILADWYYFKYDCCGKENQKTTNFFKVITFHDSQDIISICPVLEGENLPYIDLNYLKTIDTPKQKQMSRTDKFYKRYGIKKES